MEGAGLPADGVAYENLLSALARAGEWEQAWACVGAMRRVGVRPSARAYNALIAACGKGGAPARALEVLARVEREEEEGELEEAAAAAAPRTSSPSPSPGGRRPPRVRATRVTYNAALAALARTGDAPGATAVLARMAARGIRPDAFTLATAVSALDRSANGGGAREGGEPAPAPASSSSVVVAGAAVREVEALFDALVAAGAVPNTVAYNALLSALAGGRAGGRAAARVREMEAAAAAAPSSAAPPSCAPDATTRSLLMTALARGGRPEAALAVFRAAASAGEPLRPRAAAALLEACEAEGLWGDGLAVFRAAAAAGEGGGRHRHAGVGLARLLPARPGPDGRAAPAVRAAAGPAGPGAASPAGHGPGGGGDGRGGPAPAGQQREWRWWGWRGWGWEEGGAAAAPGGAVTDFFVGCRFVFSLNLATGGCLCRSVSHRAYTLKQDAHTHTHTHTRTTLRPAQSSAHA